MTRQAIAGGGWFDRDAATVYEEGRRWNGQNFVSLATNAVWAHEQLYATRRGTWVLYRWSQWQGSAETWTRLDKFDAAAWLTANGHDAAEAGLAEAQAEAEV